MKDQPPEKVHVLPPYLLAFARKLRRESTDAENFMWRLLRDRRFMGFKFRRQVPKGPYILDFYCHKVRIAIELDGGQHQETDVEQKDFERTAFLRSMGIRILRFWNNDVFTHTEGVMQVIFDELSPFMEGDEE